jgi:hypothetical protein
MRPGARVLDATSILMSRIAILIAVSRDAIWIIASLVVRLAVARGARVVAVLSSRGLHRIVGVRAA